MTCVKNHPKAAFLSASLAALLAGCGASAPSPAAPADGGPMSMAEMRINETGGPSKPAVAPPVAKNPTPAALPGQGVTTALNAGALTDAGANTILGKQWVFTQVAGYDGILPGPPTQAGFMLSRGNGRMVGSTSCNPMSAAFTSDPVSGRLSFSNLTNGSALCPRQNSDTEDAVTDMLLTVDSYKLDGSTLTLYSKGSVAAVMGTPAP